MVQAAKTKNYVIKRNGRREQVYLDKITFRIQKLCYNLNMDFVDPVSITLEVIKGLYPGVTTVELDNIAAEIAVSRAADHPDYVVLAARIAITNLHKETKKLFSEVIDDLYNNYRTKKIPKISEKHHAIIMKNADRLNSCIIYDRDFLFNYFSFKTLEKHYLMKINGKVVERPQHMLMRVAIGIHGEDIDAAIETYNMMWERYFIHSSITMWGASTPNAQLCSRFSIMMPDDSIDGIYTCITQCGMTTKTAGTVGLNIHNIRAKGTYIGGTNGISNGLVPMLRVFNQIAAYTNQGGSDRTGVFTVYLEPWHADLLDVLTLKKPTGKEELRARSLNYALWIPDLFMKRVEEDGVWSLMCPHRCPGLPDSHGEAFNRIYEDYEAKNIFVRQVKARELWAAIVAAQQETGMPYLLYKDACNAKSNQQHLGTIRCGGSSGDVLQYTSPEEMGACPVVSIALNMFVKQDRKSFDFELLKKVTKIVTRNLNKIIDINTYPHPETRESSQKHRSIAIGVLGFADALIMMRLAFDSNEAALLNKQIFETIYYGALEASCDLAERDGPYETYKDSPISKGALQFDMWNVKPTDLWDWTALREKIERYGVRNSQVTAVVPAMSAAKIFASNSSIEPYTSNVHTHRVASGEFQIINEHLLKDLTELGLWNDEMKKEIIDSNGSVQGISRIPADLRAVYKNTWEISQKVLINLAAERAPFVDQSQAMNLFVTNASHSVLSSMHFYAWKKGLKTGIYNLIIKPISKRQNVLKSRNEIEEEKGEKENK